MPIVAVLVIAIAAVAVAGGLFLNRDTTVQQVALEPVAFAGSNPFTAPVGTDQQKVTAVAAGGEYPGDTPGLYGDTGDTPSCDEQSLSSALQADPARATAWAEALGLAAAGVPTYIAGLSPVVLRTDTAVTQHNYTKGTFSPYPAVLQAGTAVFVNSYGEPKVKCYNGNPLTRPLTARQQVGYTGRSWPAFSPGAVTVVGRPTGVISNYTVVNVGDGTQSSKPANAPGPDDGRGFCDVNPGDDRCKGPTTDPASPLGPSPGKGCTPGDRGWVCPVDVDPTTKPAANCTLDGQAWSCPTGDPAMPPATGCTKAGPQTNAPWTCPGPPLDPATPPAAGCTVQADRWACPFPPNPDDLVGGTCRKGENPEPGSIQVCPQPFDADKPPALDCNSAGEGTTVVWECPRAPIGAAGTGCIADNARNLWVCRQPLDPAKPPAPGCAELNGEWACEIPVRTPPAPNCTEGATGFICPPVLDPASRPAADCTALGGRWQCPVANGPVTPGAPGAPQPNPEPIEPAMMITGQGMGEQVDPCMFMTETCPPDMVIPPAAEPPAPGAGEAQVDLPVGADVPAPCPAVPDPARPECPAPPPPPAPAPVDPGAGGGADDQGGQPPVDAPDGDTGGGQGGAGGGQEGGGQEGDGG